jgi:hypothetical protein
MIKGVKLKKNDFLHLDYENKVVFHNLKENSAAKNNSIIPRMGRFNRPIPLSFINGN